MHALGCSLGQGYLFAMPTDELGLQRLLDDEPSLGEAWDARRFLAKFDGRENNQ